MIKVAINGFGRIGKMAAKLLVEMDDVEIVGINDLADIHTQAHLLKYDSIHGRYKSQVEISNDSLIINKKAIPYFTIPTPSDVTWNHVMPDVVLECTGNFNKLEEVEQHLKHAKKVILSAPSKDNSIKTILIGINEHLISDTDRVLSNASCTTNSAGPLIKILDDYCGIESAYITTVHSYTGDQSLHDSPHLDLRRARAAALSIIPTTTGAAKAITKVFQHLEGKIGGCGIRVPVPNGSLTDISCVVRNTKTIEEINARFKQAAQHELKGILEYSEEPIVSIDIIGNSNSCIFDAPLTSVIGNMIKVVGWYDNEAGYTNRLVELVRLAVRN